MGEKNKVPSDENLLKMMNGFVDFWNGICGTNLKKFESKEDVEKFTEEIKRLEENALNKKKRGNDEQIKNRIC